MLPDTELLTGDPPIDTVPVQTGVGRIVLKVGVGVAADAEINPVVFASYSNNPSALNFNEKSVNCKPG